VCNSSRNPTQEIRARWLRGACSIILNGLLVFSAFLALTACTPFPEPEEDDEGHATFAREVIPVLLGRRAYGVDEVEVVADIAELHGRETAIDMLMKDPLFIDHWADVLVDLLRIQREPTGGIEVAQDSSCWGPPTRATVSTDIAAWVRDNPPGTPGGPTPAWNMTDLLRSAIVLDDLSPLYRVNLFTMSMRRAGSDFRREGIAQHLLQTYLNRDISCLRCHNPSFSASNKLDGDGNIVWRRTWTIPGHAEKALFDNYFDVEAANSRIALVMRGDIRQPVDSGMGTRPWGMVDACITDTNTPFPANNGAQTHTGFKTAGATNYPTAGFGSLDGAVNAKVALWELETALRQGVLDLQDGYARFPASGPLLPPEEQLYCDMVAIFSANCTGCHSGGFPSANMDLSADDLGPVLINVPPEGANSIHPARVVPGDTTQSELYRRVSAATNPPQMPPGGGLAVGDITTIQDWINAGAVTISAANCTDSTIPDVLPDEAFAFLTAANIVDGIWLSVMGYRLTIDNGFSRNQQQRDALRNLTEYTFLPGDWSLKAVLRKVLASDWMARRAPTISQTETAYELPLMLDPWVQADPSEVADPQPHERANGQGDMVNRFRVNTLLRNVARALAWTEPQRFPTDAYPSPLAEDLGQYLSPGVPGFSGLSFQSLLALEDEAGLCEKTGRAVGADDWIDALVQAVQDFDSANPASPLTLGEVWAMLKDRLIQDPTIERELPLDLVSVAEAQTEEQALAALFNAGLGTSLTLNDSAADLAGNLENKLREACGVLVKTPEFLLTNLTPRGYSDNNMPDPPRLNVCMPGETCGYTAACGKWRGLLNGMGKHTACEDRSVRKSVPLVLHHLPDDLVFTLVENRFDRLCPVEICGFLQVSRVEPCLLDPHGCEKMRALPPLDPRTSGVIGLRATDLHEPGVLVLNADGAYVMRSEGVNIRRVGQRDWSALRAQTQLRTGDQLYVPLTASLHLKAGEREFGVDGLVQKEIEGVKAQLVSITGDDAISVLDRYFTPPGALSASALLIAEQSGAFESGAVTDREWRKIIAYAPKAHSLYTPTPEEVAVMNADFDALHQNMDPRDSNPELPPPQGNDPPTPVDGSEPKLNPLWLLLLVLLLIVLALWWARRRR
jgi:hypothetical protein